MSFYSKSELLNLGFKSVGENVLLSKKASIYQAGHISLDSNIRIDDFAILSGKISIGSFVHIGAGSYIFGGNLGVIIEDFVSISSGVRIFSSSDDYSGEYLSNPMILDEFRNVINKKLILKKHAMIGSNSILLPSSNGLEYGVSIGAMSLVVRPTKEFGIYFGIPAKKIASRSKNILKLELDFLDKLKNSSMGGGSRQYREYQKLKYLAFYTHILSSNINNPKNPHILSSRKVV